MSPEQRRQELRTIWINLSGAVDSHDLRRCENVLDRLGKYIMEEDTDD